MKKLLLFVMAMTAMACFVAGCGGGGGGSNGDSTDTGRQWTYLVYMGADNNLSNMGIKDIGEMAQVGSSDKIAIVVQAEFSPTYSPGMPDTTTYRGLVQQGTAADNLDAFTNIGVVDMGSPQALTDFIEWATTNYPAEHYALVIWDHGAGWKDRAPTATSSIFRGAVQDTSAGTFMNLPDLGNAVRNAGVPLDIINFDACLMAMYEVAYEFQGLTDYMVFSEESEPGDGDPYDTILGDLAADPAMTAAELSAVIVERYDESYAGIGFLVTKSAVDMARLGAVDTAVLALGQALMNDAAANAVAMDARTNTQNYDYPANHDIYDLASYIQTNAPDGTAKDAAAALMNAVQAMVISNATNPDSAASSNVGLAIYMPTASQTNASELAEYETLACNTAVRASAAGTWGAYIEWLIEQDGGAAAETGAGGFSVTVTWTTPGGEPCDADLDLLVAEPDGSVYAAYEGTTPNATMEGDTGEAWESYHANAEVETGYYDFGIEYYADGATCTQALAEVYFNDGTMEGDGLLVASDTMDLSNSFEDDPEDTPGCGSLESLYEYLVCMSDNYSDVFYAGWVQVGETGVGSTLTAKPARGREAKPFGKDLFSVKPAKSAAIR